MGKLDGRVAVVTGAGRGIGAEVARTMAAEGAAVVVNDLGASMDGSSTEGTPADTVAEEICQAGGKAVSNNCDVTDWDATQGLIAQAVEAFGRLDILVNVAGIIRDGMIFKMDEAQLTAEGYYNIFGRTGARTEMPGCSLCMGNQARVAENSTVVSTSTRNFPNRLGKGANVYLASAELAAVASILGKIPNMDEYLQYAEHINTMADDVYRYLNFNEMENYTTAADSAFPVKVA